MFCPRHHIALTPLTVEEQKVAACPECQGLWIPGRLINQVVGAGQRKILSGMCKEHRTTLNCPHDQWSLGEATIRGVTVDFCPNCHGLWLDAGELEHLQKVVPKRKRKRRKSKAEKEGAELLLDIVGAGVEGVFDLLIGSLGP